MLSRCAYSNKVNIKIMHFMLFLNYYNSKGGMIIIHKDQVNQVLCMISPEKVQLEKRMVYHESKVYLLKINPN